MNSVFEHIYVHVPFCDYICHYCDFYTVRNKGVTHDDFFQALCRERDRDMPRLSSELQAVYFGGGTPSASPAHLVVDFLAPLRPRMSAATEVTLEANPWDITDSNLRLWRDAGVNRLSIGAQSLRTPMLRRLGRAHTEEEVREAVVLARQFFENLSADLIYAVPGQGPEDPAEDAEELIGLGVNHFSAYHLTLEPGHFLHAKLPPGEQAFRQVAAIAERTASHGFLHYEASNFGRPGFESVNNLNYWRGGSYLAWGPSAHGFDGENTRWMNMADWKEWMRRVASGESAEFLREALTPEQRQIEVLFTSLRIREGLDFESFEKKFGRNLLTEKALVWKELEAAGLGRVAEGRFAPSFRGLMLGDEIAAKLI